MSVIIWKVNLLIAHLNATVSKQLGKINKIKSNIKIK